MTEIAKAEKTFFELLVATNKEKPAKDDIVKLKQYLATHPEECDRMGNLCIQLEVQIQDNAFKKSAVTAISVDKYCLQMRNEMGFKTATALEKTLIEHVVVCWLRLYTTELRYENMMQANSSLAVGEYWEKKLGATQRRYLRAVETLARVRRLMKEPKSPAFNLLLAQQINQR